MSLKLLVICIIILTQQVANNGWPQALNHNPLATLLNKPQQSYKKYAEHLHELNTNITYMNVFHLNSLSISMGQTPWSKLSLELVSGQMSDLFSRLGHWRLPSPEVVEGLGRAWPQEPHPMFTF